MKKVTKWVRCFLYWVIVSPIIILATIGIGLDSISAGIDWLFAGRDFIHQWVQFATWVGGKDYADF